MGRAQTGRPRACCGVLRRELPPPPYRRQEGLCGSQQGRAGTGDHVNSSSLEVTRWVRGRELGKPPCFLSRCPRLLSGRVHGWARLQGAVAPGEPASSVLAGRHVPSGSQQFPGPSF